MKQKLKAALLVGAVLGLCVQTPVLAAQAKKAEQTTSKKSIKKAPVAAKSSLPAAKSAGKSGKTVASRPGKALAGNASKAPTRKVAAAGKPSAKAVRQVMMDVDGDPRRLALYSASALVVDQSNGQAQFKLAQARRPLQQPGVAALRQQVFKLALQPRRQGRGLRRGALLCLGGGGAHKIPRSTSAARTAAATASRGWSASMRAKRSGWPSARRA